MAKHSVFFILMRSNEIFQLRATSPARGGLAYSGCKGFGGQRQMCQAFRTRHGDQTWRNELIPEQGEIQRPYSDFYFTRRTSSEQLENHTLDGYRRLAVI